MLHSPSVVESVHRQAVQQAAKQLQNSSEITMTHEQSPSSHSTEFTALGSGFQIATLPHNDQAACMSFNIHIGRVYSGYRRALRWLACNRATNTVALACLDGSWHSGDLWVNCNRITMPQDSESIAIVVADVFSEVEKIQLGLERWCPQMVQGEVITIIESSEDEEEEQGLESKIIASPENYLSWVRREPEQAMELNGLANAGIFHWMQCWQDSLDWLDRCDKITAAYDRSPSWNLNYWLTRCRALSKTNRFTELLVAADMLKQVIAPPDNVLPAITARCCALAGLGRYEELLRLVHSSFYDDESAVLYWRMVAHAKLGQQEKSIDCLNQYEQFIGTDIYAREILIRELRKKL